MKKLLYLLAVLLLPFASFAQNDFEWKTNSEERIVWETVEEIGESDQIPEPELFELNKTAGEKIDDSELHEIWADGWLTWVSFGYCNAWIDNLSNTLNYAIDQWTPFKVCFMMSNAANQDIKVQVRLSDLVNGICSVNDTSIYQFISEEDKESLKEITIPAGNYIIKEFEILYPIWIEWDQWACTMFNIIKDEEAQWNIVAIVNRAYPMKFFVWTLDDVKNIIDVENIQLSLDDNKDLIMNFDLKNEWNLENLVELSGTVSNIFGYNKKFTIEWGHVMPGQLWHVTANLWSIPSYGWLYNIDFKAFATPYFSYDISKSSIDPSLIETKSFDFATKYFKMPWLIFAIAIILILLLITMFRKPKQKVVYVQNPQQPIQPQQNQQPVQPQNPGQPRNPNL